MHAMLMAIDSTANASSPTSKRHEKTPLYESLRQHAPAAVSRLQRATRAGTHRCRLSSTSS